MKRLILAILVAILAMSLSGCVVVTRHHHGHRPPAVIVTHPRHLPVRPGPPPHPRVQRHVVRHDGHRF